MLDSFPTVLRALREGNALSLRDLARLTNFSLGYLQQIEAGLRIATADVARRCDTALGSTPSLATLLAIEKGHDMLRRVLFGGTFGIIGGALLSNIDGNAALAAALNAAIRIDLDAPDWDGITADFTRRYVAAGADFGPELAAQIMIAHQRFIDGDTDAGRCAAQLTMLYGLWTGDTGKVSVANSLYATSAALADGTSDPQLRAWVRARAASRGPYEGWSVKRTEDTAAQALSLATTGPGAVEAHSAMVHLYALTGQIGLGRRAVRNMYAAAEDDGADGPSTYLRAMSLDNYLECRAGTLADAHATHQRTHAALAGVPLWQHEATIYLGRAMVAAGDVDGGAQLALNAVKTCPVYTRILGLGVTDVLAAVPAGVRCDPVTALRGYATTGPAPWETIR